MLKKYLLGNKTIERVTLVCANFATLVLRRELSLRMTPGPGIEPGTHCRKASALTTAPTLLPCRLLFFFLFMVFISFVLCTAVPCTASLGMETRSIKDAQIIASSEHNSNHAAIHARLNFKAGGGKQGAWSAGLNDVNQWIQVALGSYTTLTGIATQGRNGADQWVTKYQLQYGDDGVNFHYYKALCEILPKVKLYPGDNFYFWSL